MVLLTSVLPPTEGIQHLQPSTKLFVSDRDLGCGTLYITDSKVSWRKASGLGLSLLYPRIAVHAVSRDIQQYGNECLILMLDTCLDDTDDTEQNDEEGNSADEGEGMTELRFVPEDKGQLDAMYRAMTFCQSQHPDPNDSLSEVSEEEYLDADDERNIWAGGDSGNTNGIDDTVNVGGPGNINGRRTNPQGDEEMETDGQFEDAEFD